MNSAMCKSSDLATSLLNYFLVTVLANGFILACAQRVVRSFGVSVILYTSYIRHYSTELLICMIELKFKMKLEMYGNLVDYNSLYYLMDTSVNLGYPEVETRKVN